ncbi:helix-turn-helix transcriptional regulator [Streptomyces sp. NPDC047453]|uniref:helix-turn-helix domain-containing protein n=1 Tax=Streptomyces sp. NPDC047453 TaxID=3154812 RepID=UPI0033FBFF22
MISDGPRADLACRLRKLRDGEGVTLRALAQRAGYSPATLSAAESGRRAPTWEVTASFVQALGQDPLLWRSLWEAAQSDGVPSGSPRPPTTPSPDASFLASGDWLGAAVAVSASADSIGQPSPGFVSARRRRITLTSIEVVAALLAAVATSLAVSHPDAAAERSSSARQEGAVRNEWRTLPEARSTPGPPADATDPIETGCGSPNVVAQVITFDEVPLRLPNGMDFGRLLLRHQPGCRTSWGLVKGPHNAQRRVHISVLRPVDHVVVTSSFAGQSVDSHGQQLSTAAGCVYVEAFVETPEGRGLTARTRCA